MIVLRTILGWLDSRLRWRWIVLLPVMSVAALLEALGALVVVGLLRLVLEPQRVRTTPALHDVWLAWPTDDPAAIVAWLILVAAVFYVLRGAYLTWAEWLKESTVAQSSAKAADFLFTRYLAADYAFHLRRRSASLIEEISRTTNVAYQLVAAAWLNMLTELSTIAALVGVLVVTAPVPALAAATAVCAVAAVPFVVTRRAWRQWGERQRALEEQQLHVLQQSLGALIEVKVAGREPFFEARLRTIRRDLALVDGRRAALSTAMRLGVETALTVAMLLVIWVVTRGGSSGADTVTLMALFAYAGFRIVPSANRIVYNSSHLRVGRAFVQAALDDTQLLHATPLRPQRTDATVTFQQHIVCEDVSYVYEGSALPAITQLHLRVAAGDSLGIVGATGSGKSTLLALLLGLLTPTSGRILVDELPLAGRERAWQRLVGYVPQDPYLLDDTLRRNVAFGLPDSAIDEQQVGRACALAQLDELIRVLPHGLDTPLQEHGSRLSGGQRQRVAIARALYADPAVLMFDEATAALDQGTERELTEAIAALHGVRTLIVIAHRLETVRGCDRLIFLQGGRVAAAGEYHDLLRNPAFRAMALTP